MFGSQTNDVGERCSLDDVSRRAHDGICDPSSIGSFVAALQVEVVPLGVAFTVGECLFVLSFFFHLVQDARKLTLCADAASSEMSSLEEADSFL